MKVIVPCAGRSSRFPDMPPKWMLPDHDGEPMVSRAVAGLNMTPDSFVFTILREHDEKFSARAGLCEMFGQEVDCVILEQPTRSQSETVAETLIRREIVGSFLIKDSDNFFRISSLEEQFNYVTVSSLNDYDSINARNKSYVQINQENVITNIREKSVISDLFSVGGYYFAKANDFLEIYSHLSDSVVHDGELYISEIIAHMILSGSVFKIKRADDYQDWGTVHEWRRELQRRRVHLVSVDGFLFERGSLYFQPIFDQVRPNKEAVAAVRKMADLQHRIVYLSIRPPELEELTRRQLASAGLPNDTIIFGCGVAQWTVVTAPHVTLPFGTSRAFEIDAGDPNMLNKLDLLT